EAGQRIVVNFAKMWIDDKRVCNDQQRAAVRRGARYGLGADPSARPRSVLDDYGWSPCPTNMFPEQSCQNIAGTARRVGTDNFQGSRSSVPMQLAQPPQEARRISR